MAITCQICEEKIHTVQLHLQKSHPETTVEEYQELFPMAPLLSPEAEAALARRRSETNPASAPATVTVEAKSESDGSEGFTYGYLHEVFGFGNVPAAMNARGEPIRIRVFKAKNPDMVPDKDTSYIFDIGIVKSILMALELNIPAYLWGHAGVGKTTAFEQVCAYTGREFSRVQHTANTEESDVEGTWRVEAGDMRWQDGPLTEAMICGYVYCADEYDFASPMVASLYQAVLEGKPLRIKAANKIVRPHPDFRMVATGNTNGAGDESGLYAGTQIQNAANYERFGIVAKVEYMPESQEIGVLIGKTGIDKDRAQTLVRYANMMRSSYEKRDVAIPMSPRALINATKLGLARDSWDFGIRHAYINRLPPTSARVATETFQRVFG
jgi:cobaltochelatase CobS